MSKDEAFYYVGLFAGLIMGYMLVGALGVQHQMAKLIGGLVCGVALGYVADKVYQGMQPPRRCPSCDAVMQNPDAKFCPTCGQAVDEDAPGSPR